MSHVPLYDEFSDNYDRFVNWRTRLAFEEPFLLARLSEVGAKSVLDVACGTGHHSIALARAGYRVVGADLSEKMIARARHNAAQAGVSVQFVVAGFGQLAGRIGGTFDALLCLGNSLPHALTAEALFQTLQDFRAMLRPGGMLIIQNRNFDRILANRERFMPPEVYEQGDEEWIFFRFYDFTAPNVLFHVNTLHRIESEWYSSVASTELRPIRFAELAERLSQAGFYELRFFASLAEVVYDAETSENLVVVARAGV